MPSRSKPAKQHPKHEATSQPLFRSAAKRPLYGDRIRTALGSEPVRKALEAVHGLLPAEMAQHLKNARRERLLSWRALIDASLSDKS